MAVDVPHELSGSSETAVAHGGVMMGYSIRAVAQTAVSFRDGDGGNLLGVLNLAAGESARDWFGPQGIGFNTLYVEVESGAPEGVIYFQ